MENNQINKTDQLNTFRLEINTLDQQLLKLLEHRMELSKKIGIYKKENNMQIFCRKRENYIINRLSLSSSLNNNFIKNIWNSIMSYSREVQK